MKIFFIGSVQIGFSILEALYEVAKVDTVITLPLESAEYTSGFIDFEPLARLHSSQLIRTKDTNSPEMIEWFRQSKPDLIIVCGWQRLICKEILEIPRLETIGFHSSLLPKYRGRAPVNWAIIMGERETGITMFYLTPNADDGDIIAQKAFPILLNDDCKSVYDKSAQCGAGLIREFLPKVLDGIAPRIHNPSASYPAYPKRRPEDGLIDYNRSALDVYNFVRALTRPYPGAYYLDDEGNRIIIWRCEIVFDESRLQPEDMVLETKDLKIRILEWEMVEIRRIEREREFKAMIEFLCTIYHNQPKEQIETNAHMPKKENIALAFDEGKIVGSCWCLDMRFDGYEVGGIGGLAVDENYRAHGIASELVKFFTERHKDFETYLAWTRVVGFFEKLGFNDFSEGMERVEGDSVLMIKSDIEFLKCNYPNPKWKRVKF